MKKKEITKVENVKTIADIFSNSTLEYKDKICLWKGDITLLKIDAIVNAANSQGLGCFIPCHKCIDNAIHSSSGVQLRLECNEKMEEIEELEIGKAFLTKGYNLPAKYVIHTVGPIIYTSVTEREERQLKECYINSLEIARENKILIRLNTNALASLNYMEETGGEPDVIMYDKVDSKINSRSYYD